VGGSERGAGGEGSCSDSGSRRYRSEDQYAPRSFSWFPRSAFSNAPPPPAADASSAGGGPLGSEHIAQLTASRRAFRPLRRAGGIARTSAYTTAIFGALTVLGLLFGDYVGGVLGVVLIGLGLREGRWGDRLRGLDPRAPDKLAWNQVVFGGVIVVYCLWQIYATQASAGSGSSGDAQLDAMMPGVSGMAVELTQLFYVLVAVGGVASTELMALYYRRTGRRMTQFVKQTPAWVVEVIRTEV